MAVLRRRMPLMMIGVQTLDGRRFDALEAPRLPAVIILPAYTDEQRRSWWTAAPIGRIIELTVCEGGRVDAMCEFDAEPPAGMVLGADTVGQGEFDCTVWDSEAEMCADGVLRFDRVLLVAATLQPADAFCWPAMLTASGQAGDG